MLKITFYILILVSTISSCRRNSTNLTAQSICDCYDSIHDESVRTENNTELEAKVQSCNLLYSSILESFGDDKDKITSFRNSLKECQEK
jgi:hypothetical protein